jgi:hypothetical protein
METAGSSAAKQENQETAWDWLLIIATPECKIYFIKIIILTYLP